MTSKFDVLLTRLGTGRWNMMYFLSACYWYLILPAQTFNGVFLAPALNFTCRPPQGDDQLLLQVAQDSCSYTVNRSSSGALEEEPCTEWDFDTSVFSSTLTSEFGLVCGKDYLRATYQSIYMFSTIFSSLISGYIADKYGRKVVVVATMGLYAVTCVAICFITVFELILALRFVMGSLSTATLYMLSMEVCEVKHRSAVGVLLGFPWALGMMAWGALAYCIRDWRYLQAVASFPLLLVVPVLFLLNESPRWLIVRGRHKQALQALQRAARLNHSSLPPEDELLIMMTDIQAEAEMGKTKSPGKLKGEAEGKRWFSFTTPVLLSTPKIRLITLVQSLNIFTCSLVYCGLSLSGSTYSADPFLYIIIGGLMEVPGYTVTAPIIARWGRKLPIIIGWFISGASILALAFTPPDISWLVMLLAMIGKLAISAVFMIVFVYEAELLPTEVRLQGVAVVFVAGQIAATCSPYLADFLGPLVPWLPSVIFGVMSFLAGFSLFPLPETLGMGLPDTISDLEGLFNQKKSGKAEDQEELKKLQA
ncbi:organic cation transporter protein [Procambarus clarkii]|uniref:organic cation transporter protein n=1 Tax=Procambarus clarkii TaxID=6728 RepID=UPI001E6720CB|nr:organic cation transporter protein-like [Procambarus clarkii]XP_045622944.1 organic cation transporter protein-like [Procambarus clarkii]XP_045622945.1 organic cation transporter protein-like [Procambarus clarkii]XP_045622946.1 organic cation transporter protein-like [Procambarus clarkii]XP_045622947.1 organic cation transporter protein-like [Procambarus clarkii]XP_045622948.1 organic cation transporter protein-like [Procambarus clarkii]XP_045622949.1 organic cation transporter protein-lik